MSIVEIDLKKLDIKVEEWWRDLEDEEITVVHKEEIKEVETYKRKIVLEDD